MIKMKTKLSVLLLIVATMGFSGCATTSLDDTMKTWLNHDVKELTASWGPPVRVGSDGNGGKIFYYRKVDGSYVATMLFYVNPQGSIYYYRWEQNG